MDFDRKNLLIWVFSEGGMLETKGKAPQESQTGTITVSSWALLSVGVLRRRWAHDSIPRTSALPLPAFRIPFPVSFSTLI